MILNRKLLFAACCLFISIVSKAQLEVAHLSMKNFKAIGFGGFLNVSIPVSEADYVTPEAGIGVFTHDEHNVVLLPVTLGYRYTLDRSGTGIYLEPQAGFAFGGSDIQKYNAYDSPIYDNGKPVDQKVTGPVAGLCFGYLFEPSGRIQFNISARYEHIFAESGENVFSIRIAHAFSFGRRE